MLSLLHIENIAVIRSADIRFEPGFNVLTGETGAGKSIVIDAIGAVIGERTSRELIRTGARSARVEAAFCALPELPWFRESGLGPDENGELLLEREIQADGRNLCRANGRPLTVSQLRQLGRQLLNIHGQHDGQQLLDPACHLDYLDRFGQTGALLEGYAGRYRALTELLARLESLRMDEGEKARRVDTLIYQIGELERARLQAGEEETLTQRRELLRNAGRIMDGVERACFALSGDEEREGAVSLLTQAGQALEGAGRSSDDLAQLAQKAQQLRYAAEDLEEQVRDLRRASTSPPGSWTGSRSGWTCSTGSNGNTAPRRRRCWSIWSAAGRSWRAYRAPMTPSSAWRGSGSALLPRPGRRLRPSPGAPGGGRAPAGAHPAGAGGAGHAPGALPGPVRPQGGGAGAGRHGDGPGAVPHVRQRGGGAAAHSEDRLRGRAGRIMLALKSVLAENDDVDHPGL